MSLGESFVSALAQKDKGALRALLAPDVDFKGLTPRRLWEASDPDGVVDILLANWFEDDDRIDGIVAVEQSEVEDVRRVGYRLDVVTPDGSYTVEQQAYYRAHDDQLSYLRLMCSGFRPKA